MKSELIASMVGGSTASLTQEDVEDRLGIGDVDAQKGGQAPPLLAREAGEAPSEKTDELIQKAKTCLSLDDPEKALSYSKMATEKDPSSAEAWFELGECFSFLRKYSEAVAAYKKATEVDRRRIHSCFG